MTRTDASKTPEMNEKFMTAEIADQYGGSLQWARRLTDKEKSGYQDWFAKVGLVGIPDTEKVEVREFAIEQIIADRQSDGEFLGCRNKAWTITAKEWGAIVTKSKEIDERIAKKSAENETQMRADQDARNNHPGWCEKCQSYCYGDCES